MPPAGSPPPHEPPRRRPLPRDPLQQGLSIALATGIVGISFGVLARAASLPWTRTLALSALVFTGASQFAAVGAWGAGAGAWAAFLPAALLAIRNSLYGPVVAGWLPAGRFRRWGAAHFVIDESTAVGAAQADPDSARIGFWVTGLGIYLLWNTGTMVGVWAGAALGDPRRWGLDTAFSAAFLALLAPHLRRPGGRVSAVVGAAFALLATPFAPAGTPILLAAAGALAGARWAERPVEAKRP